MSTRPAGLVGFADAWQRGAPGAVPPGAIEDRARLAEAILSRSAIREARRVRVLSYGALRDVDFHALPFEGAALLHLGPVEYPLDTGRRAPLGERGAPMALVVADPNGDLPAARREARGIADTLAKQEGWTVKLLEGVTRAGCRAELTQAASLHYAGTGVYAGREAGSVLPPRRRSLLRSIHPRPHPRPFGVVLSSCESARTASDAPAEGLSLAQAFIAAGSDSVVAAVRPVRDDLGSKLSKIYHEKFIAGGRVDAPAALREAQLAIENDDPLSDWPAFRVLLP